MEDINSDINIKVKVPDAINFVWIGNVNKVNLEYINIWSQSNVDKEIHLWIDECGSVFKFFHEKIRQYVCSKECEDKLDLELNIKNKAYNYFSSGFNNQKKLKSLVISFLMESGIVISPIELSNLRETALPQYLKINSIHDLFTGDFSDIKRFYYYEVILRGNFASASDIVRLLVLYRHGGIYLDIDTLPETDSLFKELNDFLYKKELLDNDFILSLKTKFILEKLGLDEVNKKTEDEFKYFFGFLDIKFEKLVKLADKDLSNFSLNKIPPLGKMHVHRNLLALSSIRKLKGVYFNNFLASHPKSKGVKIIIRNLRKRYRFIERNNCIFGPSKENNEAVYLTRLLTWRTELYTHNYVVTTALTGPGLLVESLLGIAYHILDISPSLSPLSIASTMQNHKYGIALFQHNLHTPDGSKSSWRK